LARDRGAKAVAREPPPVKKHDAGERLSPSGIPVKPVYHPEDAELDYASELGDPGQWPYTRGVQPTMYRGRLWTMRQYAGFGTAAESNERYRYFRPRWDSIPPLRAHLAKSGERESR